MRANGTVLVGHISSSDVGGNSIPSVITIEHMFLDLPYRVGSWLQL